MTFIYMERKSSKSPPQYKTKMIQLRVANTVGDHQLHFQVSAPLIVRMKEKKRVLIAMERIGSNNSRQ
jgi:hypothetical protein